MDRSAGDEGASRARLLAEETTATRNRRLAARLRSAEFPFHKTIEDFDFQPRVDRKLVEDLAALRSIDENRAVLFLGQTGCGKTHLSVALDLEAAGRDPAARYGRRGRS